MKCYMPVNEIATEIFSACFKYCREFVTRYNEFTTFQSLYYYQCNSIIADDGKFVGNLPRMLNVIILHCN